jgi:hypothetical protein
MKFIRTLALGLLVLCALALPAAAQGQLAGSESKNQYSNIEVGEFKVESGINFPADYQVALPGAVAAKLKDLKKFKQVIQDGEKPTDPNAATLQVVGTVIDYKPGSQAKRYLVGFGTGKTKVTVHAKFIDKATGQVVLERDVVGKIEWGVFGGQSKSALGGVGKEIAQLAKKKFF